MCFEMKEYLLCWHVFNVYNVTTTSYSCLIKRKKNYIILLWNTRECHFLCYSCEASSFLFDVCDDTSNKKSDLKLIRNFLIHSKTAIVLKCCQFLDNFFTQICHFPSRCAIHLKKKQYNQRVLCQIVTSSQLDTRFSFKIILILSHIHSTRHFHF